MLGYASWRAREVSESGPWRRGLIAIHTDMCMCMRAEGNAEASSEPPSIEKIALSGRLGQEVVRLSENRMTGSANLIGRNGLKMESTSNFCSILANSCVFSGKWMYEITLETAGIQQVGWAIPDCSFSGDQGEGGRWLCSSAKSKGRGGGGGGERKKNLDSILLLSFRCRR